MNRFVWSRYCRCLRATLAIVAILSQSIPVSSPRAQTQNVQNSLGSAKEEVSAVIRRTIERSKSRTAEGVEVQTMPLHPSKSDVEGLKKYGDAAVEALSSYAHIQDPLQQHAALVLLAAFQSEPALAAVRAFADSRNAQAIRLQAIAALAGFPLEKIQTTLQQLCADDNDPTVRKRACEVLKRGSPTD